MALKKSQLYSSLWQSCDELRGGMDASQYKDYVLTLLFMKYVSDKAASAKGSLIEVPEGASFRDMVALKGDKEIGDKINKIIGRLAEANDLKGVIDQADFNDESKLGSGKEMQDRLSKLVAIFDGLDFRANRAEGDDLLGDAYEYLMRHFATESGKSKGQFYTPAEVSRIMAQVIGIERADELKEPTVYDPTCGSGSLLIKVADEGRTPKIAIYGQEMDVATWALARMNMFLHGHATADLWRGNTLSAPHFKNKDGRLKTFDFAVANPPFSAKAWSSGLDPAHDEFGRFELGVPPAKNGDYAFLLHLISSLKSTGKGAIILPHGVLFRGHKEAGIRRQLVQRGLIKGIIGLPPNLFYGTGIPACIVVIDKEHAHARTGIFMIDASRAFLKDGNKNRLRSQDIHKIVDVFKRQAELPRYSRMVPVTEIASPSNDYNLNLPRYIDSREREDLHDLEAHLNGGIPVRDVDALDEYWRVFPTLRQTLFRKGNREGYLEPSVPANELKQTVLGHAEFQAFAGQVTGVFEDWCAVHEPALRGIKVNDLPRELIHTLSEDLLTRFAELPLLSRYDVYQRLMDYWVEVMQDDVYLIAADGWAAETYRVLEEVKSGKRKGEMKDKGWACDLIPKPYLVAQYFAKEQADMNALEADLDAVGAQLAELSEEYGGDEGPLKDVSSKADAQEAYTQALLAIWNEEDNVACTKYSALVAECEHSGSELRSLTDHPNISALINSKGRVTLKAIKDRVKTTGDESELKTLQEYLDIDKQRKAGAKESDTVLAQVDDAYRKRLKLKPLPEELVDFHAATRYLELLNQQSDLTSKVNRADALLDKRAREKYLQLTKNEIKRLVVENKWFTSLRAAINGELQRVTQQLAGRVQELEGRYAHPLPALEREVQAFSVKVEGHLKNMGLA